MRPRDVMAIWPIVLSAGLLAMGAFLMVHGGYYFIPLEAQVLDPLHSRLRSSGRYGLVFGIVGTGLVLLNLTYLLRRRMVHWRWPGSLRHWMNLHVASGLLGAGCIVLHSALSLRSALGIMSVLALGVVVLSGIIGRYLYAHVPRSIEGRELRVEEVRDRLAQLSTRLRAMGVDVVWEEREEKRAHTMLGTLAALVVGDAELRRRYRQARHDLLNLNLPAEVVREAVPLLQSLFRERHWLRRYRELMTLMASWRFLHRWLALVMLGTVFFHIVIAVRYADLWVLGGRP